MHMSKHAHNLILIILVPMVVVIAVSLTVLGNAVRRSGRLCIAVTSFLCAWRCISRVPLW
jgi:hypothetical protein